MMPQKNKNETTALTGPLIKVKRWVSGRNREAVMGILCGESVESLFRKLGAEIDRLAQWHVKAHAAISSPMGSGQTSRSRHSRASPPQGLDRASGSQRSLVLAQACFADC
jgi:hypothetical protein